MGDPRRTQSDIDIHDRDHILATHRKSNSNQIRNTNPGCKLTGFR